MRSCESGKENACRSGGVGHETAELNLRARFGHIGKSVSDRVHLG